MNEEWVDLSRPGYFGRDRDQKIASYDKLYGKQNWRLVWQYRDDRLLFNDACIYLYERSYYEYLVNRPEEVDFICSFGECIDNAETNIESGLDYMKQESGNGNHIQDIAIRNVLSILGRKFEGPATKILVVRGKDSEGSRFSPGKIPFCEPAAIRQPTLDPKWADKDSVESWFQSNKILQIRKK